MAREGRPGPVLLDVPKDVQNQKLAYTDPAPRVPEARRAGLVGRPTPMAIVEASRLIGRAQRPLIMAGHGVILATRTTSCKTLAEQTGIPVITTLLGISAFPESHPLHLGMPGMHGEVHVNRAIQQADLHHRDRAPVRRPGDRQPRGVRPRREDRPHRARPLGDRQERAGHGRSGG